MIIVQVSDFTGGYYNLLQDSLASTGLQDYIDKYESKYIYRLFGSVLGATMITNCQNTTITFTGSVTSGSLQLNEPIIGLTSGATGKLVGIGVNSLTVLLIGGTFTPTGEVLQGQTSLATWTETSYVSSTGIPTDPNLTPLFNAFNLNDPNDDWLHQSEGLKKVLMAFIWFHFVADAQAGMRQTLTGWINPGVDTAGKLSYQSIFAIAENKWNEAIEWTRAIQWYCLWFMPNIYTQSTGIYWFQGHRFEAESSAFL